MKVKAVLSILALAALTACGGGVAPAVTPAASVQAVDVAQNEPIHLEPQPVFAPSAPAAPTAPAAPNAPATPTEPTRPMVLCDAWSYNPCATPTWIPAPEPVPAPEPEPVRCDRDCKEPKPAIRCHGSDCAPSPLPSVRRPGGSADTCRGTDCSVRADLGRME